MPPAKKLSTWVTAIPAAQAATAGATGAISPGKLSKEDRPGGIRVPAGQVGAVQAGGPTRYDQRPDDGADCGRSDDQMRRVGPHEVRGHATVDFELGRRDHRDGDSRSSPASSSAYSPGVGRLWSLAPSPTLGDAPGTPPPGCHRRPLRDRPRRADRRPRTNARCRCATAVRPRRRRGYRRRPGECVGEAEGRAAPDRGRVRPGRRRRGSAGRGSTRSGKSGRRTGRRSWTSADFRRVRGARCGAGPAGRG